MLTYTPGTSSLKRNPIWSNKLLITSSILSIGIWIIFKKLYVNINMVYDSYYYIYAAEKKLNVNIWPIGYSYFIRLTGLITHSPLIFTTIQYIIFQLSLINFYFTINRFYKLPVLSTLLYCLLIILNPIIPYTCNFIMSDALFAGLTIFWFSNVLQLLHAPKIRTIVINVLLIISVIAVRYNSLYYPLISTAAFLLCKRNIIYKIAGIFSQVLLIYLFIAFISFEVKKIGGHYQFSPFGGWKIANNALYMYDHINNKSINVPDKFSLINKTTINYFNNDHVNYNLLNIDYTSGSWYMFDNQSPLVIYMHAVTAPDTTQLGIIQFCKLSSLMQDYGGYLIKKYPIQYGKYFIFPNTMRYLIPPTEIYWKLSPFNLRNDFLKVYPERWFGINSLDAPEKSIKFRNYIFNFYPSLVFTIHLLFLLSVLGFILFGSIKKSRPEIIRPIYLLLLFWLTDFGFNIFASGVVLRYLIITVLIEITFILLVLSVLWSSLAKGNLKLAA